MGNRYSTLNSHLRKACLLAIVAHLTVFAIFRFNVSIVEPRYQETKTALNIILAKPQEVKKVDSPAPETQDIIKPSSTPVKEKVILIIKEQLEEPTQSKMLAISPNSIRAFTDEYAKANSDGASKSLSSFEESFVVSLPDRTRKKDRYLIEGYNGIVDVKTDFLGKSVCYKFDADADFSIAMFYKCDNDVDFVFEMKH